MPVPCPSCGKPVAERATRCPFCGTRTRDPSTSAIGAAPAAPPSTSTAATRAVDLAKLARIAQDLESLQSRQRKKRDRWKVAGVAIAVAAFVGAAVLMLPWFQSLGALGLLGDVKGGGAAHMAAERVSSESASLGSSDTPATGESSGPDAGDAGRALAERAGGAAAPPADLPASAPQPAAGASPSSTDSPRVSGTATLAKLDDLARLNRARGAPKASASTASSNASPQTKSDGPLDWLLWKLRAAGFVAGLALVALVARGTRGRAADGATAGGTRGQRLLRTMPLAAVLSAALGILAYQIGPELAKRFERPTGSPVAAARPPQASAPRRMPTPSSPRSANAAALDRDSAAGMGAAPSEPPASATEPDRGDGSATRRSAAGRPAPAKAAATRSPTSFAALVTVLRDRPQPAGHGAQPYRRLRAAVSARRTRVVAASAPVTGANEAGSPAPAAQAGLAPTVTKPPAATAPMTPKPEVPGTADPAARRKALLLGLLVGLALGSVMALAARALRSAPRTAAAGLIVFAFSICSPGMALAQTSLSPAIAAKFESCYQAEANEIGDEDRTSLDSIASELGTLVPAPPANPLCPGASDDAACATAVAQAGCDVVANALSQALGVSLAEPEPEAWAKSYGSAVSDKLLACLSAETGAAPAAADSELVASYGQDLARLAGALGVGGRCHIETSALAPCLDGIRAASCGAVLDAVGPTLTPVEPATTEPTPSYEEAEAAAEADAPAPSDAELDQQIDAVAASTRSPVPFFADVCRSLLVCETDSAFDETAP